MSVPGHVKITRGCFDQPTFGSPKKHLCFMGPTRFHCVISFAPREYRSLFLDCLCKVLNPHSTFELWGLYNTMIYLFIQNRA